MNSRRALYAQSIRGPVLLITVGVLFAVHQAGVLSFSRTWPLLIIVIGLMKLLERTVAPPAPPPPQNWTNPQAPFGTPYSRPGPYGAPPSYSAPTYSSPAAPSVQTPPATPQPPQEQGPQQ